MENTEIKVKTTDGEEVECGEAHIEAKEYGKRMGNETGLQREEGGRTKEADFGGLSTSDVMLAQRESISEVGRLLSIPRIIAVPSISDSPECGLQSQQILDSKTLPVLDVMTPVMELTADMSCQQGAEERIYCPPGSSDDQPAKVESTIKVLPPLYRTGRSLEDMESEADFPHTTKIKVKMTDGEEVECDEALIKAEEYEKKMGNETGLLNEEGDRTKEADFGGLTASDVTSTQTENASEVGQPLSEPRSILVPSISDSQECGAQLEQSALESRTPFKEEMGFKTSHDMYTRPNTIEENQLVADGNGGAMTLSENQCLPGLDVMCPVMELTADLTCQQAVAERSNCPSGSSDDQPAKESTISPPLCGIGHSLENMDSGGDFPLTIEIKVKKTDGEEVECGEAHKKAEEHEHRIGNETEFQRVEGSITMEADFGGLTTSDVTSAQMENASEVGQPLSDPTSIPLPFISDSQECGSQVERIALESITPFNEERGFKLSFDMHNPPNAIVDDQLVVAGNGGAMTSSENRCVPVLDVMIPVMELTADFTCQQGAGERTHYPPGLSVDQSAKEGKITVSSPLCKTGLLLEDMGSEADIPHTIKIKVNMTDGEEVKCGEAEIEAEEYGQRIGNETMLQKEEGERTKDADFGGLFTFDATSVQLENVLELGKLHSDKGIFPVPTISDSPESGSESEQIALESTTLFKEQKGLECPHDMHTLPNTIVDHQLVAAKNGGVMTLTENQCLPVLNVMCPVPELTVDLSCQQGAGERTHCSSRSSDDQPAKDKSTITNSTPFCGTSLSLEDMRSEAHFTHITTIKVKMKGGGEMECGEAHGEAEQYGETMGNETGFQREEDCRRMEADFGGLATLSGPSAQMENISEVGRLLSDPRSIPLTSMSDSQECGAESEKLALESTALPVLDVISPVTELTSDMTCQQGTGESTHCPSGNSDDQPAKEESTITVLPPLCRTGLLLKDMKSEAHFPDNTLPLQPTVEENCSTLTKGNVIADERMEDKVKISEARRPTMTHVGTLMHTSIGLVDAENKIEVVPPVNFQTSEPKCLETEASSLSQSKLDESLRSSHNFSPIIPKHKHPETDMSPLTVMKEQLPLEPEMKRCQNKGKKKSVMPGETASFPQEWEAGPSYNSDQNSPYSQILGNDSTEQRHIGIFNQSKNKRKNLTMNREIRDKFVDMDRVDATINSEQYKTILDSNTPQSLPSKKYQKSTKKGVLSQLNMEASEAGHEAVHSIDVKPEEKSGLPENSKSLMEGRAVAGVPYCSISGKQTTEISCQAFTDSVLLETTIPCVVEPVGSVTETTVKHAVKNESLNNEKLIDSQLNNSHLNESFEGMNKSTGIGQNVQRKRKKKRKAVRKKRAQTKLEMNEYNEAGEVTIIGAGDKWDIHGQCTNDTEKQMAKQVCIPQDKEEDAKVKSPACNREDENILSPENFYDHNSQIHKTKKERKAKQLTLFSPETHLRSYSSTCSNISVDLPPVPEKTPHQVTRLKASSFIKPKRCRKRRAQKSKRKSQVVVTDLGSQETCIISEEEGGAIGISTACISNASMPDDTMLHNIKKRGYPRKKMIKDETDDMQKNLQRFSKVGSTFEQQRQNFSHMDSVLPSEVKNECEGTFQTSSTKKNVRKPKKQKLISRVSPLELVVSKEHNAGVKIPDPTSSLLTPQPDRGKIIGPFTQVDKEAQGNLKKENKAQKEELMAITSVKEEHMGAEERFEGLKISGSVGKCKKKLSRPYNKKTLVKMAEQLKFAEEQRSDERDVSALTELGNELLPQDIILHIPKRCKVRKISKKVKCSLSPPVTNLRKRRRACTLTMVEKIENFARDHNPLTMFAGSTDQFCVESTSSPAGYSAPEASNEIDASNCLNQKPRRQRRPPKNTTVSQAINGKDLAKSGMPNNLVFIKQPKFGYPRTKVLKEEITGNLNNVQTIPKVPSNPEKQSHNVSQFPNVSSSEIKMDLEGPPILAPKKKVKKPKNQKCNSTIFPKELSESTGNEMDMMILDTTNGLIIPQKAECEMISTLPQVNKSEHCNHKKIKGVKDEPIEATSVVGQYRKAEDIIAGPETSGTVIKSKMKNSRLCKKKTQNGNMAKEFAMEQSFPLDIPSQQVKKSKIKKGSKTASSESFPPVTHLRKCSQPCKITSSDEMEHHCAQNSDKSILLATSGSTCQLIFPKGEVSPSSAVSNKACSVERKPLQQGRAPKKERKPPKSKDKGQGGNKLILSVHEHEVGVSPVSETTGTAELTPNSFITRNPPKRSRPLKKVLKEETVVNQENMTTNVITNLFEQQPSNVPEQAFVAPSEMKKDSVETCEASSLSINKKIKKRRIQKPNCKISTEVMFENTEHSAKKSQGVANDILIPQQSGCETFGTGTQVVKSIQRKIKKRKAARKETTMPTSALEKPRKTEDVLAIIQTGGAVAKVKGKRGRPYKKKTLIKMAKQFAFIEEQRLTNPEIAAVRQMENHSGPQTMSSHQVQVCKQRKISKKVALARPPTPIAHLRRYSRACKVTTDYTFEKIKERLEYNLNLSSTYVRDTLTSAPEMAVNTEISGSVEPEKTLETIVPFASANTVPSQVQSLKQEDSNMKTQEFNTVLNSIEDTKIHEDNTTFNTSFSFDTGITPSFQDIVELRSIHLVTKKPRKTISSKKMGRKRRRTWWDDRGKAKRSLGAILGPALEATQDEGRMEPGLQEKRVKQNYNSATKLLMLGQRTHEKYSDSDISGAMLYDFHSEKADREISVGEGPLSNGENDFQHAPANLEATTKMNCKSQELKDHKAVKEQDTAHVYSQNAEVLPKSCSTIGDIGTIDDIQPQKPEKETKEETTVLLREQQKTTDPAKARKLVKIKLIEGLEADPQPTVGPPGHVHGTHKKSKHQKISVITKPRVRKELSRGRIKQDAYGANLPPMEMSQSNCGIPHTALESKVEEASKLEIEDISTESESSALRKAPGEVLTAKNDSSKAVINHSGKDCLQVFAKMEEQSILIKDVQRGKLGIEIKDPPLPKACSSNSVFSKSVVSPDILIPQQSGCETFGIVTQAIMGARSNMKKSKMVKAEMIKPTSTLGEPRKAHNILSILQTGGAITKGKRGRPYKKSNLKKMAKHLAFLEEQRQNGNDVSVVNQMENHSGPQEISSQEIPVCKQRKTSRKVKLASPPTPIAHLRRYSRTCKVTTEYSIHKIKDHPEYNLNMTSTYASDTLPSFPGMEVKQETIGSVGIERTSEIVQFASVNTETSQVQSLSEEHSYIKTLNSSAVMHSQEDSKVHEDSTTFNTSLSLDTRITPFQEIVELNGIDLVTKKPQKIIDSKKKSKKRRRTWWDDRGKAKKLLSATLGTVLSKSQDKESLQPALEDKIPDEQNYNSDTKLIVGQRTHEKYSDSNISGAPLCDSHSEKADLEIYLDEGPLANGENYGQHAPEDVGATTKMDCKSQESKDQEVGREQGIAHVYSQNAELSPNSCSSVRETGTIDEILQQKPEKETIEETATLLSQVESAVSREQQNTTEYKQNLMTSTYVSDTHLSFPVVEVKQEIIGSVETEKTSETVLQFASMNTASAEVQSLPQVHCNIKTLEPNTVLNSTEDTKVHKDITAFNTSFSFDTGMTPSFQEIVELSSIHLVTKKPRKTIGSKKKGKKRRRTWWDDRGKSKRLLNATLGTALNTSQDERRLQPAFEEKIPDVQNYNSDSKLLIVGQGIHEKHSDSDISGTRLYDFHSEKANSEISVGEGPLANGENDSQQAPEDLEAATKMNCKSQESNDINMGKEQDITQLLPNSCSSMRDLGTLDEILSQKPEKETNVETTILISQVGSAALSREQQNTTEYNLNLSTTYVSDTQTSASEMAVNTEILGSVEPEKTLETIVPFASANTAPSELKSLAQEDSNMKTQEFNAVLNSIEYTKVHKDNTTFNTSLSLDTGITPSFQDIVELNKIDMVTKKPQKTINSKKKGKKKGRTWWDDGGKVKGLLNATLDTILNTSQDKGILQPALEDKIPDEQNCNSDRKLLILGQRTHEKYSDSNISGAPLYDSHSEKADREISVDEGPLANNENYGQHAPDDMEATTKMNSKSQESKDREVGREQGIAHVYSQNDVLPNSCSSVGDSGTIYEILPQKPEKETKEEMTTLLSQVESTVLSREQQNTTDYLTSSTYDSDTVPYFHGMEVKQEIKGSIETERTLQTIVQFASVTTASSEVQSLSQEHSNIKPMQSSTMLNSLEDTKEHDDTTALNTSLSLDTGMTASFEEIVQLNSIDMSTKKPQKTIYTKKRGKKRRRTWWDDRGTAKKSPGATLGPTLETSQDEARLEPGIQEKLVDQNYDSDTKLLIPRQRIHEKYSVSDISRPPLYDFHSEKADRQISVGEGSLANGENDVQLAPDELEATTKMNCKSLEVGKEQDIGHVYSQNATVLPNSCSSVGGTGTIDEILPQNHEEEMTTLLSQVESVVLSREQQNTTEDQVEEKLVKIKPIDGLGIHKNSKWQKRSITSEPRVLRDRTRGRIKQDAHGDNFTLVEMSQSICEIPPASLESTKEVAGKLEIEVISTKSESSAWGKVPVEELGTKKYYSKALLNHSGMEDSLTFAEVEEQSTLIKNVQSSKLGIEIKDTPLSDTCSSQSSFYKLVVSEDQQLVDEEKLEDGKGEQLQDADKSDRNNEEGDTAEKTMDERNVTANPSKLQVSGCLTKKAKFPAKCKFCGRSFRHITAYIIHRRIHTCEKPYGCQECGKTFAQLPHLNVHKKVHKLPRHLQCPLCNSRFSHKDKLLSHFLTHTNDLNQNNLIGESANDIAGINAKIDTRLSRSAFSMQDVKPFKCMNCGKQFSYSVTLKRHTCIQRGDKPFSCKVCDKAFSKACKLSDHEKIHWPVKPFACSVCGKAFNQLGALKTHSRTHTGEKPFSCAHCGDAFLQLSSLRTHQASKSCLFKGTGEDGNNGCMEDFVECQSLEEKVNPTLSFQYPVCSKSYDIQSEYNLHLLMHTDVQTPVCDACGQQFNKISDHSAHRQICCRLNGIESQNASTSEVYDTSQFQHNLSAQSPDHLQTLPLNNQQSECTDPSVNTMQGSVTQENSSKSADMLEICQSSSTDSRLVSTSTNGSIRPCCKIFKSNKMIQAHMLTSTPRYSYTCGRCGKALENWNKYWLHQRMHRQKPGGFHCPQCSQHFHFHGLYKEHMLEHAKQTPYVCPFCPIAFADKESLMEHQGEEHRACNTHKCHTCGRHFIHLRNLEQHNLLHRGAHPRRRSLGNRSFLRSGVLPLPTNSHSLLLPDMAAEAVSLYRCGECNANFTTLDMLAIHQLCHSTGDRNPQEHGEIVAGSLTPEHQHQPRSTPSPTPTPVLSSSPHQVTPDQRDSLYAYQHPEDLYVYPTPSTSFPPPVLPSVTNVLCYRNSFQIDTSNTKPAPFHTSDSNRLSLYRKQVLSDHLYAAPPQACPAQSSSHSTSISFSAPQLLKHPPQPHMSKPLQLSSSSLSVHNSWALASPNAQINMIHFRSNGDLIGDFCSVPLSYVKLKNKEEIQESLECAECGTQFGAVSELYEHYIQHARGEV